jgi:hypothetical protein
MPRFINPVTQYTDSQGELLVEGFLRFEESGTNTLKPVYHDADLTIQATNPVKLDGAGRVPSLFTSGSYKVTAFKNDGVGGLGEQQWERDPVGSESGEFGADWDSATTYGINEIVLGSDGAYYESIANNNVANDPTTTPSAWSELVWFHVWNSLETYAQFDLVKGSDGIIYYSVLGSNLGNDPISDDGTNWLTAATVASATKRGVIEIATQAEVDAGTDTERAITPDALKNASIVLPDVEVGKVTFMGALARQTSGQSITTGGVILQFDSEDYDTDAFHDNVTNNTRLTVPSGVSRVRLIGSFGHGTLGNHTVTLEVNKNGASLDPQSVLKIEYPTRNANIQVNTPVVSVSPGDYFELNAILTGLTTTSTISSTWFGIEVIE